MSMTVRAVYEQGNLRLLDPVRLSEGEQVEVTIANNRERIRAALGDLVVQMPASAEAADVDEEALLKEIEEGFKDAPSLSDIIIEERRTGP